MEFASLAVGEVLDPSVEPVKRQLGYIFNYGDNVEELKRQFEELQDKRTTLNLQVEAAKNNAQVIEDSVTNWLEKAQSNIDEVDQFLKDERHQKTGCSQGFPNLKLRHQLGRKAKKMSTKYDQLLKRFPNPIFHQPQPKATETALHDGGYVPFKSREDIIKLVMGELRNPTAKMIGIYGHGGVGKSTLVKEVARTALKEKLFSVAVIANITSTPDVRKIQGQIADTLGLRLDDESLIGRASRLGQRLKDEKNALVILDDLWAGFDLRMLGILLRDDDISQMTVKDKVDDSQDKLETEKSPGDSKGCKILVTSRSKDVMSSEMGIKGSSIFHLNVMEKEEALELFKKVAGVTEEDSELNLLPAKIANKCSGLPVAIITVANALRNTKTKLAWETTLEQMERREAVEALQPVEFSTKLSYDHMQSEELKSFFLLCARISKNPSIADLMKYCIGLGIFQGVSALKEARDRTYMWVNKLKASSLLLDACSSDQVTMHDLVRDAALSIAFKEQDIFTMRHDKLDEWPDKEKLERYTAISLHHCDINDEIPESLNCPRLKVFHVESNNPSLIIPDELFEGMGELRVLILIGLDFSSLPSSIKSLKKLRMLCLEQCVLGGNMSIIGELKKLRVLSLSESKFENLPSELRQLSKLRLLDISNCTELRVIPPNVISNLISLEELYIENDLIQWGVEGQTSLEENAHLQQLKRLDVQVQDVATLPRSLSYHKLDGYKIVIGCFERALFEDFKMRCMLKASRALALHLKKGNDIYFHMGFIKMLFKSVDHLLLGELVGVRNVIEELNLEGFPCLKHLTITNNPDIQYIINSLGKDVVAFPNLESMYLYKLPIMEKICGSLLTETSFCNLRTIKISICSRLKNLFPFFMIRHLIKLEIIEVSECEALQEIVFQQIHDIEENIEFPRLRTLTLQSLPMLTSFYTDKNRLPISQKDEISVADEQSSSCASMLFNINVSVQNLTQLNVKDCGSLKYLFSLSVAGSLGNLQSLSVERCATMEHIFEQYVTNNEVMEVFPQLKRMEVTCMKELKTVWCGQASLQSFCSLDSVVIKDCDKLDIVFPNSMMGRICSLGRLEVMNCKSVKKIFDDVQDSNQINSRNETSLWNLHIEMLPKLTHIWSTNPERILGYKNLQNVQVIDCSDLENVFPISVAQDLSKLEYIRVSSCPKMKEIVSNEGRSNENIKFDFRQLTTVAFQQLPKLTSFCQGIHSLEFSALKQLYLILCDRLNTTESILTAVRQVISKLEAMGIGPKEMEWLQDYIGNDFYQLHNLKTLYLDGLRSMETPFQFLKRTPNLENLFLVRCFNKEMLSSGSLVAQEKIWTVVHLKCFRLWYLHGVQNIGFLNHPIIQRVEQLYLVGCSSLVSLFPSFISLTHLTHLKVSRCPRLENLMTSSTAKSLVQLIEMQISQCETMEEIVIKNEKEIVDEIAFSKLKSLEFLELGNLKCFCSYKEGLAFKFPSLEKLILRGCFKMKYFCNYTTCIPKLKEVNVAEKEEGYWKADLNATIKKISEDMVFFQYTKDLQLFQHQELEEVCQGQIPMPNNCFRNLKSLVVVNCFFLSSAFLSKLLSYLKNLEKLEIKRCRAGVIFDIDESRKTNGDSFRLKTLTLDYLPYLECVWSEDPHGFFSFPNLQEVVVNDCVKLETLLPESMTKNLVKLEVSECHVLKEIVGMAESGAFRQSTTFQLPSLTSLLLYDLPELQCFYPGISILECPKLDDLRVIKCTKLDIFTSEVPSHQGALGHVDEVGTSSHKQPLFLVEKVPSLETLWLNKKMTSMLCLEQFHAHRLDKLKELKLFFGEDDNETATTLPFEFLQKLPNLTRLSIEHFNSLKHMLPSQNTEDINSNGMLASVGASSSFLSFGSENSLLESLCLTLEHLQVKGSPCLTILECSSVVSFFNLKQLIITECHRLHFLLSSSVAKSLEQLETMVIKKCNSLEQILSTDTGESTSDEVIFEKLTVLELISLSGLITFCSWNIALHFPILKVASIRDCPMMKIFSQGVIRAPNFMAIQASEDRYDLRYYKDLNSSVEKLSWDRVRDVQFLKLRDHPQLEYIWRRAPHRHSQEMSFTKLKSLVVEACKIDSIIPFHLLLDLRNLEALEVRNCVYVKTIIEVNDTSVNDIKVIDSGPPYPCSLRLKKLILEELPNLEFIWNEEPQGILSLQCLQQVCVNGCKSITSLFPTSVSIDKLEKLEVKYCKGLKEIIAKDKTEASSNKVFIFHNLSSLTLWELPELKYFYSGLHQLEWPKLNLLNVYHCFKLRTFIAKFPSPLHEAYSADEQGIVLSIEKVVPRLKELILSENDFMMFSHHRKKLDRSLFTRIRYLKLMCFHGDQTAFPFGFFFMEVRYIQKLLVGCSGFKEILPSKPQLTGSEFSIPKKFGFLPCLNELELNDLHELVSIGLEYSWHSIPHVLESLRVVRCSSLIHLVPPTVSFSSLAYLTVTECHKLGYLFTPSTARSLTFLKNMYISRCDSLKEIVANEVDDSVVDVIMLHQLKTLSLDSLPKLECFYSGSSMFIFVCLDNVSINECGVMKTFCQRDQLKTPQLPCDLNARIQEAHNTKTTFSARKKTSWELRSQVDKESTERDEGPDVHHGALFRIFDSIVLHTSKLLLYLMDSQLVLCLDFVFCTIIYLFTYEEDSELPSDGDREPNLHQGALFRIFDSMVLHTSKLLSYLMDNQLMLCLDFVCRTIIYLFTCEEDIREDREEENSEELNSEEDSELPSDGDREPNLHQGALFRIFNSMVLHTSKLLSYLMDSQLMLCLDFVCCTVIYLFTCEEDSKEDREEENSKEDREEENSEEDSEEVCHALSPWIQHTQRIKDTIQEGNSEEYSELPSDGDREPNLHQGALSRKIDSIAYDRSKHSCNLLDRVPPHQDRGYDESINREVASIFLETCLGSDVCRTLLHL